jgi:hypothetical protein
MVDDTLGIAECGDKSIAKNAVINSFIETERLTMSKEKSSVIHVAGRKKCKSVCPKLMVHDGTMKSVESAKYLGDIITSNGSIRAK